LHRSQLWQIKSIFRVCINQICLKYWCSISLLINKKSCESSWLSSNYILNSIMRSSDSKWTKNFILCFYWRMQSLIELILSCTNFLTRQSKKKQKQEIDIWQLQKVQRETLMNFWNNQQEMSSRMIYSYFMIE